MKLEIIKQGKNLVNSGITNAIILGLICYPLLLTSCLQQKIEYDCTGFKQDYKQEGFYAEDIKGELYHFNKGYDSAYFAQKPSISLNQIKRVVKAEMYGSPTIRISLNEEGSKQLEQLTKRSTGKHIGIFIQDQLIMAPVVNSEIKGGEIEISSGSEGKDRRDELHDYLAIKIYCEQKSLESINH